MDLELAKLNIKIKDASALCEHAVKRLAKLYDERKALKNKLATENRGKFLRLKVVSKTASNVKFKIHEQSHRGTDFGNTCNSLSFDTFQHMGVTLVSSCRPELLYDHDPESADGIYLYVRGSRRTKDKEHLSCSEEEFIKIERAVAAYNKLFSETKETK